MTPAAHDPGWRRLLAAARRSLERTGGSLDAVVSVAAPTEAERLIVIGATGTHRSAAASRLTVRLAALDAHLREAYGTALVDVIASSAPLRDRPGDAKREAVARDAAMSVVRGGRHAHEAWYEDWLDWMRRDGALTRIVRTGLSIEDVVRVLDALPLAGEPMPVFADRMLGDPKALAEAGLRWLVLRAIALWQGTPPPATAEQERALWESVGVVPDDLASQVLVLNLPASGGLVGSWLTEACRAGVPVRITLHQLRLTPLTLDCDEVFVCENPAVLRAAADLGAGTRPLVCTEGAPSAAVHRLLAGAPVIRWRNDFDWTGIRLTGNALHRYPNAVPWRMFSEDYRRAAAAQVKTATRLVGTPADTPWDPPLRDVMRQAGCAVMEERLLDDLLRDLRGPCPSGQST